MTDEPERLDAPNQQVVRPDGSHPADEGSGGSGDASTGKPKRGRKEAGTRSSAAKADDQPEATATEPRAADKG